MYRWKTVISVFASASFAVAFVFAAQVSAQESAWGGDVEDFSTVPAPPAELKSEAGTGDPNFGAALEAAAAAEAKPAAEHVPKNEIIIEKRTEGAAAPNAEKKKEKKERSGERLGHSMGGRLGIGSEVDLGLGFGIGLTDINRIELGWNMFGLGIVNGDDRTGFWSSEAYVFYEWRFGISDELSWFGGAGGTIGYHGTSWRALDSTWTVYDKTDTLKTDPKTKSKTMPDSTDSQFGIGVGARFGLEVDLSFIDPDHSLSMFRSSSISLDARPVLYILPTAKKFPVFVMTVGINYKYVFGGGKSKDAKDKEKK